MRTSLIIALLSFATASSFAQNKSNDNSAINLKNNGAAALVKPTFDRPYRVLFSPPCREYKRHGLVTMECPGIFMAPESGDYDKSIYTGYGDAVPNPTVNNDNWKQDNEGNKSLSKK